ncbi:sugar porter family MFS transporter [Novipirellula artificiosorum]|uniref:D-xylose-proton symporter n=1 Tax=Novipirellula artificiosorum TaxID=2528016 RepID=A0A5C6DEX2_9BACT|nr:sugar porter family MFS transporter [Novipirellula artificiosorum]TWU34301.1 D-xylose-proton symporter [Novipirellula artificiosorum]
MQTQAPKSKIVSSDHGSLSYLIRIVLVATLGGLLFGYDTAVIAGAIGFLQTHFELNAAMKGWAASSALAGCVLGVLCAGPLSDRFGRRKTLIFAAVMFFVSAIGTAVPRTLTEFVVFRFLGGMGVGAASMTSPMYIAEISPARLRGRMVSINQFAIVSGMLVVYFVNYFIVAYGEGIGGNWNDSQAWRWMFGSEAIPAVALFVLLFFVPESPRWLMEKGREEQARSILTQVDGSDNAEKELGEIRRTVALEPTRLSELLTSRLRTVLMIGIALAVLQQVTGINVFLYYAPEIFKSVAGAKADIAMLQTVVVGAVNLGFTVVAIWLVDKVGRKPLMIVGTTGMGISLLALGCAAWLDQLSAWALIFILAYIASFALSVGPVTWVILSEIFPTKFRGRALSIATVWLWVANFGVSQTFPMMDENPWLVETFNHGFPFLLYAAFCVLLLGIVLFAIPETKGQTLEQIEKRWLG